MPSATLITTNNYMAKEQTAAPKKIRKAAVAKNAVAAKKLLSHGKAERYAAAGWKQQQAYPLAEAIALAKKVKTEKFDASVEIHIRLGIDPRKGDQQVRANVSLPHGTGKSVRIAAFVTPANEEAARQAGADLVGGEELIEQIAKSEKTDFQVAVAEPAIMRSLARIAKILGTRGLMPSPKNDTVTADPAKAITELKKGKITFKNDNTSNIHGVIGRLSFSEQALLDNLTAFLEAVRKAKPASAKGSYIKNVSLSTSMGPGIKVQL